MEGKDALLITLGGKQSLIPKFEKLLTLYCYWNEKINISSIKDERSIVVKHFIDSIFGNYAGGLYTGHEPADTGFSDLLSKKNIIDIGTGGGFPLLPLAILNPDSHFTAMDSVLKKLKVIEDIAYKLGLKNVDTLHGRAEELAHDKAYREKFDFVTTRAFAPLSAELEMTMAFIKVGGAIISYRTPSSKDDVARNFKKIIEIGLCLAETNSFELPFEMGERIIFLFNKIKKTNMIYPRKMGIPRTKLLFK